jgi:5-methylthioadenosine/S-adenosylhomocysteine deaminase
MLLSGTTTFTDMYYFEDVVAEAAKEAGMRGVLARPSSASRGGQQDPADGLAFTERYLKRFQNDPLITAAVALRVYAIRRDTQSLSRACQQIQRR